MEVDLNQPVLASKSWIGIQKVKEKYPKDWNTVLFGSPVVFEIYLEVLPDLLIQCGRIQWHSEQIVYILQSSKIIKLKEP